MVTNFTKTTNIVANRIPLTRTLISAMAKTHGCVNGKEYKVDTSSSDKRSRETYGGATKRRNRPFYCLLLVLNRDRCRQPFLTTALEHTTSENLALITASNIGSSLAMCHTKPTRSYCATTVTAALISPPYPRSTEATNLATARPAS